MTIPGLTLKIRSDGVLPHQTRVWLNDVDLSPGLIDLTLQIAQGRANHVQVTLTPTHIDIDEHAFATLRANVKPASPRVGPCDQPAAWEIIDTMSSQEVYACPEHLREMQRITDKVYPHTGKNVCCFIIHASDCAFHNDPAEIPGPCSCGALEGLTSE